MRSRMSIFMLLLASLACRAVAPTTAEAEPSPTLQNPTAAFPILPASTPVSTATEEIILPTNTPAPALLPPVRLALLPLPKGSEYEYSPYSVAWSPDGKHLASGGLVGVVSIWDVPARKMAHSMWVRRDTVTSLSYSRDGERLASGDGAGVIQIWTTKGALLHTFEGHTNRVANLAWSPEDSSLISLSSDNTLRLWDVLHYKDILSITEEFGSKGGSNLMDMSLSPDGNVLATAMFDKTVDLRDPATLEIVQTLPNFSDRVGTVLFSPNGSRLFVYTLNGQMTVLDTATWEPVWKGSEGTGSGIFSVAWSPDGRFIATAILNRPVNIWDAETGVHLYTLERTGVQVMAWSPDGTTLAMAVADGMDLWSMQLDASK